MVLGMGMAFGGRVSVRASRLWGGCSWWLRSSVPAFGRCVSEARVRYLKRMNPRIRSRSELRS